MAEFRATNEPGQVADKVGSFSVNLRRGTTVAVHAAGAGASVGVGLGQSLAHGVKPEIAGQGGQAGDYAVNSLRAAGNRITRRAARKVLPGKLGLAATAGGRLGTGASGDQEATESAATTVESLAEQRAWRTPRDVRRGVRAGTTAARGGIRAARATGRGTAAAGRATGRASAEVARRLTAGLAHAGHAAASAISSALASISPAVGIGVLVVALVAGIAVMIGGTSNTAQAASYAMGDDYPFKDQPVDTLNTASGYYVGNCTDFVWWRVNRDAGSLTAPWRFGHADLTPVDGNGANWGLPSSLPGWSETTDPVPGDVVAIRHAGTLSATADFPGHVAYVGAVDGEQVTTENYGNGHYYQVHTTVSELRTYISDGWVTVKHNPAGRVATTGVDLTGGDTSGDAKSYAASVLDPTQLACVDWVFTRESGWNPHATNPSSGAYGIPQALPAEKMASAGADWHDNPITQVKWGLQYMQDRYGGPCNAQAFWSANGWY
ncbi:aggregation-promoting factor C-terminal-like domain-containing protein (plasmid) [Propionibacterium freudenreichii]|uniref:aggregation-promoting factor C-terminal-like domain-containing protein n=1 Tax=Propionibacterium freudenreichii TaxID=1744 RepID=UPI00254BC5D9|nr:CHAP domain-containing protein [Propionibacterium freudenreichii]